MKLISFGDNEEWHNTDNTDVGSVDDYVMEINSEVGNKERRNKVTVSNIVITCNL